MLSESSIKAKYKRARLDIENTSLWENISSHEKANFLEKIELKSDESCIIFYKKSKDYFWSISNKRLIVFASPKVFYIPFESISEVKLPELDAGVSKREIDSIDLVLEDNHLFTLFLEKTAWHFIYELLRFLR